jgi:hypothetical protein
MDSFYELLCNVIDHETTFLKEFGNLNSLYFKLFLLLPHDSNQDLTMDFLVTILTLLGITSSELNQLDLNKVGYP